MKLVAWGLPVALLVAACGTVGPGQGEDLSIETAALPDAVVGRDYRERNVVLQAHGSGSLSWSLPQLPPSLSAWLSIGESTGLLQGTPFDVVSPSADFVVQVTNGSSQAQEPFKLAVGCHEGISTPCGVPDPTMCVAGTRVCLGGKLGTCTAAPGHPPYEADATHCGPDCDQTCPRTTTNRCVGTCACGSDAGPCSGATPACCPGADGRPESFSCVSLQSPEHCGACQTACQAKPNTTPGCASSACTFTCDDPWRNCNGGTDPMAGVDADGCETRVDNQVNHCGACGKVCPSSLSPAKNTAGIPPFCEGSQCRYGCSLPRFHNCTGGTCRDDTTDQDADGCETDFSSVDNCGGRGACPGAVPNAHRTCTLSSGSGQYECGQKCDGGFDPDPCGVPLACKPLDDPENCGTCGRSCPTVDTDELQQHCSLSGQCCMQICDPQAKPPCGPERCH
jgi:putative Ig domain-containing protein